MPYDYEVRFNLGDCIKKLDLEEKGRVQQFVTNEILRRSALYVPLDIAKLYDNPGALRDSGHIENGTDVVWNTPYARRLYYHDDYQFQGAPTRGAYWVDRMLLDGGLKEIEDGVRRAMR